MMADARAADSVRLRPLIESWLTDRRLARDARLSPPAGPQLSTYVASRRVARAKEPEPHHYPPYRLAAGTSAEKVFQVPELLEQILLRLQPQQGPPRLYANLDAVKELFALQRVSRSFRNAIEGSTTLKRRMGISPSTPLTESLIGPPGSGDQFNFAPYLRWQHIRPSLSPRLSTQRREVSTDSASQTHLRSGENMLSTSQTKYVNNSTPPTTTPNICANHESQPAAHDRKPTSQPEALAELISTEIRQRPTTIIATVNIAQPPGSVVDVDLQAKFAAVDKTLAAVLLELDSATSTMHQRRAANLPRRLARKLERRCNPRAPLFTSIEVCSFLIILGVFAPVCGWLFLVSYLMAGMAILAWRFGAWIAWTRFVDDINES